MDVDSEFDVLDIFDDGLDDSQTAAREEGDVEKQNRFKAFEDGAPRFSGNSQTVVGFRIEVCAEGRRVDCAEMVVCCGGWMRKGL